MDKKLTPSLEKYLLAIYELVEKNQAARVKDVSNYLKIGGPSTSDAVKTLAKSGYINYVPYGIITITQKGRKKAIEKLERHKIISKFFKDVLNVEEEKALQSASTMEYSFDDEILEKFVQYLSFQDMCSCKKPKWKTSFEYYSKNNQMQAKCQDCMAQPSECSTCGAIGEEGAASGCSCGCRK